MKKKLSILSTLLFGFALAAVAPAFAKDIDDKVEAYKKSLEAEKKRRESVYKGNDLEWEDLVDGTPRVVSFTVKNGSNGLDLSGPYFGYMFNKNLEVGVDSEFNYDSLTKTAKDKDPKYVTNNRSYFFGARLTVIFPMSARFSILASLSPGLTGGLTQEKNTVGGVVTDTKYSWGPGFSLRMMPIGVGWRFNQFEVRTGMFLEYANAGGEIGAEDSTYKQFTFQHAAGLLELRHYF